MSWVLSHIYVFNKEEIPRGPQLHDLLVLLCKPYKGVVFHEW